MSDSPQIQPADNGAGQSPHEAVPPETPSNPYDPPSFEQPPTGGATSSGSRYVDQPNPYANQPAQGSQPWQAPQPGYPAPGGYPGQTPTQPGFAGQPTQQGFPVAPGPIPPGTGAGAYRGAVGPQGVPGQYSNPVPPYAAGAAYPGPGQSAPGVYLPTPAVERVGRGLLFATGGVVAGIVLSVIVWQAGVMASITSLVLAAAAVWLYSKGATTSPKKGMVPLIVLIVLGVVLAFVIGVASDAYIYLTGAGYSSGEALQTTLTVLGEPALWAEYGRDAAFYAVFAALGLFVVLRRLARPRS